MSESIRQNNLFGAEDYKKIFKAYQYIDYTAYDFDTLKQALINYIQTYYPEDFNDYIESSEFIAIIELLAYFGTSLAFRTELNSRENFIDTAERRESIIRLAQMVNYAPRRNIPASGMFKIAAVQTDQPLVDANGIPINDVAVFWDDPNNIDWFDQFIQICNSAFSSVNPFGRPTKSGVIGSIPTDLYQLDSLKMQAITYQVNVSINGQQYPIDICNPDFITNHSIFERDPDPLNAFNFIYRNDSLGVGSVNTGFFLYFKQGTLVNVDTNFEFPVPNRVFPIGIENINQDDVYVQETDQRGNVISKWKKVPALAGENIIYNSLQFSERNIFSVIPGPKDTISLRFADGNFGNVPTGLFRTWIRISANQNLVIRPDAVQGMQINIPYIGVDKQQYTLKVIFNLEQTISNAAPSETNEQIRLRAPEVFSTQSRMVNGSDYNVLPLVYGNQIAKIQAIERTYSGHSRYIDINDPTGFHRDLVIFGQDGALYRDDQHVLEYIVKDTSNSGNIDVILINTIQEMIRDSKVSQFFYDEYITQFERVIRVNSTESAPNGYSILDLSNPASSKLIWRTSPAKFKNDTGYFSNTANSTSAAILDNNLDTDNISSGTYEAWGLIRTGAVLQFNTPTGVQTTSVNSVIQSGMPVVFNQINPYAVIGPITLGNEIQNNSQAIKFYPVFRDEFTSTEIAEIITRVNEGVSFWLYYDLLKDTWGTSTSTTPGVYNQTEKSFQYAPPIIKNGVPEIYSNWGAYPNSGIIYINIANNNQVATTTYELTARGRVYVFESYRDVRFFWKPNTVVVDNATQRAFKDTIDIMPLVNTNAYIDNNSPSISNPSTSFLKSKVSFNITDVYVREDGYQDTAKVKVSLVDENYDGIPDDPYGIGRIFTHNDRLVFEYYVNEVSGYQSTRPWIAKWDKTFSNYTGNLYVYFPADPNNLDQLYSAPYISNTNLLTVYNNLTVRTGSFQEFILTPENARQNVPTLMYVYLDEADLIFISQISQIHFTGELSREEFSGDTNPTAITVANQISAFFNYFPTSTTIAFPWLEGTQHVNNKADIIRRYFFSKSFLLAGSVPGHGIYNTFEYVKTDNLPIYPSGKAIISVPDKYHFDKNGKAFTQNLSVPEISRLPLHFKWSHYSPIDQRVDPAPTNIIDMIVITNSYYTDMINWKNNNGTLNTVPIPPTTEDLRIHFQDLDQYKMISDSMIWNSGEFKILFGSQAPAELQATFKVVKAPSSNISDNEVKTKVVNAIDTYFDIRNWDFGEKFFYTELAAFIHQQLSKIISSVVIVPDSASSQFGNLFEIVAGPNQLFLSTATVNNVAIVSNLTDKNLRV